MKILMIAFIICSLVCPVAAKDIIFHPPDSQLPHFLQIDRDGTVSGSTPGGQVYYGFVTPKSDSHIYLTPPLYNPKTFNPYVGGYDPNNPLVK